jgi:protoheme ferro-lyase
VLYDLDVAARAEAESTGPDYHRVPMPNTDPAFIAALATVAMSGELSGAVGHSGLAERRHLAVDA